MEEILQGFIREITVGTPVWGSSTCKRANQECVKECYNREMTPVNEDEKMA